MFTMKNIMIDMKGLEEYGFDDCLKVAQKADIEGIIVPLLHINHPMQNKKAVNRPKDQLDVIYLEKSNKSLKKKNKKINQNQQNNNLFFSFPISFH